jgi:hypothetical protein
MTFESKRPVPTLISGRTLKNLASGHFEERSDENRWPSARFWRGKSLFGLFLKRDFSLRSK